jgi:hypothetical protein
MTNALLICSKEIIFSIKIVKQLFFNLLAQNLAVTAQSIGATRMFAQIF